MPNSWPRDPGAMWFPYPQALSLTPVRLARFSSKDGTGFYTLFAVQVGCRRGPGCVYGLEQRKRMGVGRREVRRLGGPVGSAGAQGLASRAAHPGIKMQNTIAWRGPALSARGLLRGVRSQSGGAALGGTARSWECQGGHKGWNENTCPSPIPCRALGAGAEAPSWAPSHGRQLPTSLCSSPASFTCWTAGHRPL